MATTAEYLTQLQTDKATLVTNLVAKGVDATNDETFTTLVPKVASIQGGSKYAPRYISFYRYKGTELNEEIANLDISNISSMSFMFAGCSNIVSLDLNNFDTSKVTDMSYMFNGCSKIVSLDLSSFDTSKVTNMSNMFSSCDNITTLDLSSFDTSKVTDMGNMFSYCQRLTTLDLSSFDTSSVTYMSNMFSNCGKLTSLDLSSFDTSKVTNMSNMFNYCQRLTNIKELDANNVSNVSITFSSCKQLTDFGGLKNLGQAYLTTQSANYYNYKLDLSKSTLLTEQSMINVLNNLYDIKTKGCKSQQVILGATNLAKLTSTEGQQALSNSQAKGWSIS